MVRPFSRKLTVQVVRISDPSLSSRLHKLNSTEQALDLLTLLEDPVQVTAIINSLEGSNSGQMLKQADYFVPRYYEELCRNPIQDNDNLIPTPPLSPSLNLDSSYLDPSLSMMVHPDRVLSQPPRQAYQNLNPLNSYPVIPKEENLDDLNPFSDEDYLSDEFSYDRYFDDKKFGHEDSQCLNSADWWNDYSFENSITAMPTNDMQSSFSTNNVTTSAKLTPESDSSRSRLYSGVYDPYSSESAPLFEQIDAIELNFDAINCRPDTPDESTDADATESTDDAESDYENQRRSNHVLLEHNYNFPASKKPPTPKKQRRAQAQTMSDDEVDVVTYEDKNKYVLNRVCRFNNISSPEEIMNMKNFPDVGATVTIAPAKPRRGRCTNTPVTRRVGRPPKTTKRLQQTKASSVKDVVVQKLNSRGVVMDPEKRSLHNLLERDRRVNLKVSFDEVRKRVPSLIDKPKAPKVLILNTASSYINSMAAELERRETEIERLTVIRKLLREQLNSLSSSIRP